MTVYADVLICINLIIDYLIIGLTAKLLKTVCSFKRQLFGGTLGGICALFILLPQGGILQAVLIRTFTAVVVVFASFGIGGVSLFVRRMACFLVISFVFSGTMFAVWYFIRPAGLLIHNGIVYYNLSSVVLVVTAIFTYCLISLISRFMGRNTTKTCRLKIDTERSSAEITALIDSGNKLREPFSEKPVILLDPKYNFMMDDVDNKERVIPYNTVSGGGVISGVLPKAVYLMDKGNVESLDVYLAISPSPLGEFDAIIGTDAL